MLLDLRTREEAFGQEINFTKLDVLCDFSFSCARRFV